MPIVIIVNIFFVVIVEATWN
jgi:hypothetical protein